MHDAFQVLPHRDLKKLPGGFNSKFPYQHRPCGMDLTESAVKEENWCPHCGKYINLAAARRAREYRLANRY